MPHAWSRKVERQYKHIRDSSKQRGTSEERAEEIAARTVNKQRREEGRTPNRSSQGTGNPNQPLEERTKRELYNLAADMHIAGRSNMNKHELVAAIHRQRQ